MNKAFLYLAVTLCCACTHQNQPLTNVEKDKIIGETKGVISSIYRACENCDPEKLTENFLNSPDFVSLINGDFNDYDQTVKNYPVLMNDFKTQKATILSEKYAVLDPSTVLYTSTSNWKCRFKNDSIAVYEGCSLHFLLKKENNHWKVLSWTEAY